MPVTRPVYKLTVAVVVLLLFHVPPEVVSLSTAVEPVHTVAVPVIGPASGLLSTVAITLQPVPTAYVTVAIPDDTPVTAPVEPMVATSGLLIDQVPPDVASDKLVTEPTHTLNVPVTGDGVGLIVTVTLPSGPQHAPPYCALK